MSARKALETLAVDLAGCHAGYNAYHDRAIAPGQTLSRIRPLFPALGITRVGLLTGLDTIGIPVAFATRPNSHTPGCKKIASSIVSCLLFRPCFTARLPWQS